MKKCTSFKYRVSKKLATLLLLFSSSLGHAQYCTPVFTTGCSDNDDINSFILNGENSTGFNDVNTGCSVNSYDNRTAQPAVDLAQGLTYNATVSSEYYFGSADGDYCTIWIDFNDNNTFESSEIAAAYNNTLTLTGSLVPIAIPASAALGNHRMRVMVAYPFDANGDPLQAGDFNPCGDPANTEYAEVHDYTINVVGPPSCLPPAALNTSGITPSTATLGWTENGTATQWNVQYGVSGFTLGTGTTVSASTTPSYTINSGLNVGTSYDFYVRAACSVTDLSSWAGPFTFLIPVPNDECTSAISLTPSATCSAIAGTNAGSTPSSEPPASCVDFVSGNDVWYSFQAANTTHAITLSDILAVNPNAAYYECGMAVYSGSCNALTPLGCALGIFDGTSQAGANIGLTNLSVGETYYIRIWSDFAADNNFNDVATDYTFNICVKDAPQGAVCANPLVINTSPYTLSGNTGDYGNFYTNSPGTTGCGSTNDYLSGDDAVFSYTASANGTIDISLTNLGDTYAGMFVYNDCSAIGNSCAAGVVNSNASTDLAINAFNVTANTTYYIVISTWASPQTVAFTLNINGTAPLPVDLGQLKGALTNSNIARLSWTTFKEQNNKGFAIQRSDNGKDFSDIGFVASSAKNGNSAQALNYTFNDVKTVTGASYYRLQQTDIDGKTTSSNIVRLSAKEDGIFTVMATPNPVTDLLTIQTKGIQGNLSSISISDVTGKLIRTIPVNSNKTIVDMSGLPQGLFFIKYTDTEHTQTIKISKQ